MEKITIRRVLPKDSEAISQLNERLGFTYPAEKVRERIQSILDSGTDIVLVAEVDDKLVGYVHACPYNTLYAERLMSIIMFIFTDDCECREEASEKLLKEFEHWALHNGYHGIRMAADAQRDALYELMLHNGYENKRDLKHYIKYFTI